jgi:hypothetical protein
LSPTIQHIAGSCRRRSASFTSSYPARRPNTDCRSNPANAYQEWSRPPEPRPPQAGYWCSRFARRPNVRLIWCGNDQIMETGSDLGYRNSDRSFTYARLNLTPLTWTSPCKDWSLTSLREKLIKIGAKGRPPRSLRRLPDGRGRYSTPNVPGDFAAHRGTAAAATTSASMRRSTVMRSRATQGRSVSECHRKWPDQAARLPSGRVEWWQQPAPRTGLARRPEKRKYSRRFGVHLGNSGLNVLQLVIHAGEKELIFPMDI